MSKNDILIKVNQLYKIFGDNSNEALDLVKDGMGKDELLEKCNCVLGLNNINLDNIENLKHNLVLDRKKTVKNFFFECVVLVS